MVKRAAILGAVLLTGCFPPPLDETGKKCDAVRPCGEDYSCVSGFCVNGFVDAGRDAGRDAGPPDGGPPDAGPPDGGPPDSGPYDAGSMNVLLNGDFEEVLNNVPIGWKGGTVNSIANVSSVTTPVSSGQRAAKLSAIDGGLRPSIVTSAAAVKDTGAGEFWCARMSARAANALPGQTIKVGIFIRERSASLTTLTESTTPGVNVSNTFVVLEEQHITLGAPILDLRLQFLQDPRFNGESVIVDDARLRRTYDGGCFWPDK